MSGFDQGHARRFLGALYTDAPGYLNICFLDTRGNLRRGEFFRCAPAGLDRAAKYARGLDDLPAKAIYHRVTTMAGIPDQGRGGAADTLHTPALWGDLDFGSDGHKGDDLPADADEALAIYADSGLPDPTMLVHSGGGYYPLLVPDRPLGIGEAATLSERVQNALLAASVRRSRAYGTGVKDLARVLRLPGSTNWKTGSPRPCRVVGGTGKAISVDAIPDVAPRAPEPSRALPERREHDPNRDRGVLDVVDERVTWAQILEPVGWTFRGSEGYHDAERWLRPGEATSEYSARCFPHNMVCHSESAGLPSGAGQRLTKGRVYAWLYYGGDVSAAARGLIRGENPSGLPGDLFAAVSEVMAGRAAAAWAELTVVASCEDHQRAAQLRPGYRSPTQRSLRGLVDKVLTAAEPDRAQVLGWAGRKLGEHVAAETLTAQAAAEIVTSTATAAGLDPIAAEAALRSAGCTFPAGAR